MDNPNVNDLVTPEQPPIVAKTLDALPGLIGAIDQALLDKVGQKMPFVLLVFGEGSAMHATNIIPVSDGIRAVKDIATVWAAQDAGDAAAAE